MAVTLASGREFSFSGDISSPEEDTGDATMLVALEVNLALWGMIVCASVKAAEFLF
jgi:hypothetical protein